MTQDEYEVGSLKNAEKFAIIRMAREAGIAHAAGIYMEHIERFAALVAAHEREACAKVCEDLYKHLNYDADCRKLWPHTKMINDQYAAAIRARGNDAE